MGDLSFLSLVSDTSLVTDSSALFVYAYHLSARLWLSILVMVTFIVYIYFKIRGQNHPSDVLLSTIQKLYWYPVIFLASWIIPTVSIFSGCDYCLLAMTLLS
jgi:hypothetical protein